VAKYVSGVSDEFTNSGPRSNTAISHTYTYRTAFNHVQYMQYEDGEHIPVHSDHKGTAARNGIVDRSPVAVLTLGDYEMDFVLMTANNTGRTERCRWAPIHNSLHVLGEKDSLHLHAACAHGKRVK
jgi:hypothetical protein